MLVAPRVFRAPRVPFCGPGRCVCWWAAARPRAVRATSFARRVVSKPGQAPPPPTSTAARPSGPSGALHTGGARSPMCGALARSPARPCRRSVISHVIPLRLFQTLNSDRWNSTDSALVWGRAELELHAELGEFPVSLVELVAQGCTTWVGIALLSCRCNAVLSGALVLYLVHRFAVVKLVTPFRPCVSAGLKPASPLLA